MDWEDHMDKLKNIRRDYSLLILKRKDLESSPIKQFENWMEQALASNQLDPNAATLSTIDADGMPSGRIILLRGYGKDGFTFYTNYNSKKGKDIAHNNKVCLTFYWAEQERQIRIS